MTSSVRLGNTEENEPRMADAAEMALQRMLVQHLQGWRRAGLTHLPRGDKPGAISTEAVEQPSQAAAPPASAAAAPQPTATSTLFGGAEPASAGRSSVPRTIPSTIRPAERRDKLAALAKRVAACARCEELACTRTQTVFGVGDPQAKVMFIGEAPGADEDARGEPFVGRAGQLLDKIIAACQWRREDVYICNVLKCRPPSNRTPTQEEADHCREYLDGQIEIVDPDYIVCWGSVAATNLLGVKYPIGRMRGRFFTHGRAKVVCTYHPSYLLRNPAAKKDVWEDMKFLLRHMGIEPAK